jgi:hypothetical protein
LANSTIYSLKQYINLLAKLSLIIGQADSKAELASQTAVLEGCAADLIGLRLAGAAVVSSRLSVQALLLATNGGTTDLRERDADGLFIERINLWQLIKKIITCISVKSITTLFLILTISVFNLLDTCRLKFLFMLS